MRRLLIAIAAGLLALGSAVVPSAASAIARGTDVKGPLGLTCEYTTDTADGLNYWLCGGKRDAAGQSYYGRSWGPNGNTVRSWDGTPLDVDVTLPANALTAQGMPTGSTFPLLVMMHGWGGSKGFWESQTVASSSPEVNNYNNVAFVKRGYAVLTYSARGHRGSCGALTAAGTPGCERGWAHLGDQRFEVRDTQFLAGKLADAGVATPDKVGVTGLSYGGGQSWELAIDASSTAVVPNPLDPTTYDAATYKAWRSPRGKLMHLAVAVPHYTWTDLANSLQPNGRAADGVLGSVNGDRFTPIGIEKFSFVNVLFASTGGPPIYYEPGALCAVPATCDRSANLQAWFTRISAGEPYSPADPILQQAFTQIKTWKSAYYLDTLIAQAKQNNARHYEVPILVEQGWTDDLFSEVEAVSMINKLKSVDPNWPVNVALSDIGHPRGQNKANDWAWLDARGNDFIDHYMLGTAFSVAANQQAQDQAQISNCAPGGGGAIYTAGSFGQIHTGQQSFASSTRLQTVAPQPIDLVNGLPTDPIVNYIQNGGKSTCVVIPAGKSLPGAQSWTFPLTSSFTLVGDPLLHLDTTVAGSDVAFGFRLWDVDAQGNRTLVTRGMYRWNSGQPTTFDTELLGNGWDFACGHSVQLEVTQNDGLYLRPDNEPSSVTYNSMNLALPTAGSSTACSSGGTGAVSSSTATQPGLPSTGAGGRLN